MKITKLVLGILASAITLNLLLLIRQLRIDYKYHKLGNCFVGQDNPLPVIPKLLINFSPVYWWSYFFPIIVGGCTYYIVKNKKSFIELISYSTVVFFIIFIIQGCFLPYSLSVKYLANPIDNDKDLTLLACNITTLFVSLFALIIIKASTTIHKD